MKEEKEVPIPSKFLEFIGINLSDEAKKKNDEEYLRWLKSEGVE